MAGVKQIILIAGSSGSGKSSIAGAVARSIGLSVFCLDGYYRRGAKVFLETPDGLVRSFERPELYDGGRLAFDLARRGGVGEGFALFCYPEILGLPAKRFYIDVPFPVCVARREARRPQRPSDRSFAIVGAEENARFVAPQKTLAGVTVLDGSNSIDGLAAVIVRHVHEAK